MLQREIKRLDEITLQRQNLVGNSPNHVKYAHILDFEIFDDIEMHDANEMECLIFENAIKNILLGKVTKSGVSDANNKLIITIFQMWGHIDPIRSGIGLTICNRLCISRSFLQ